MRPYYAQDGVEIYLGDALELLAEFRADVVITDPPYGLGFSTWDAEIPDWLPSARRAAPVVAFTTAPTTLWNYPKPDWLACWARPGATSRTLQGGFNHWSPVLVYGPHKLPTDLALLPNCANEKARATKNGHPCAKPLGLLLWLVSRFPGELVLDPFMGSGTTLVAAKLEGRRAIGFEIDERYCEIAAKRLAQGVLAFGDPAL